MVTVLVPHVGGPILPPCEPTVLTGNYMPQARISDMATCVGPPDVIAQGSSSVTVRGLFAARQMDMTVHGGNIVMGWPTVLIGGPVFTARPVTRTIFGNFKYGSAITINSDSDNPAYQSQVLAALIRLDSTPTGARIINAIEGSGNSVSIEPYNDPSDPYNATTTPGLFNSGNSTIAWNPGVNGFGPAGQLQGKVACLVEQALGLQQVDDVNAVAFTEDETAHLRVPATRLVTEVDSGLQQLLDAELSHVLLPLSSVRVSPTGIWSRTSDSIAEVVVSNRRQGATHAIGVEFAF
jgi:uncharacterized Zn-binding protein involved in type VI secretion